MSIITFDHPLASLPAKKRIALVAHDAKKREMCEWVKKHRDSFIKHELYATGTTGTLLEKETGLSVKKCLSGPLGGDQQIGALIAEGKVDMLIFFWDPMEAQPHDPDIKALLRVAVTWNLPFACDRATADFMLTSPLMQEDYTCTVPDYSDYVKRKI